MRYIDEMLRGIPVEELLGDSTAENKNETKAVQDDLAIIPDEPAINVRKAANGGHRISENAEESELTVPDLVSGTGKPIKSQKTSGRKAAGVKRSGMGILAAALSLVIGMGGVMTYFGAVRHSGPLASVFTSEAERVDRETADRNAKEIYSALTKYFSDTVANGEDIAELNAFAGEITIMNIDDPALSDDDKQRLELLRKKGAVPQSGDIFIYVDSEKRAPVKVQWRSGKDGYVGQYPEPADSLVFGDISSVPDSKTDDTAGKDDANKYAKLLYTTAAAYCADKTSDGLDIGDLKNCVYEIRISENEQTEIIRTGILVQSGAPAEQIKQMSLGKLFPEGSEICMFFGERSIIKAQYRASEKGYVGQYPEPADGIDFGLGSTVTVDERAVNVKMKCEVSIADFKSVQRKDSQEGEASLVEMRELEAAERFEVTDPGPKIYGEAVSISLYYKGDLFRFRSSDRANADVIIDDKYYIAPKLKLFLDRRKRVVSSTIVENGLTKVVKTDEDDEALWYGRFLKEKPEPVSDPGRQIAVDRMYRAVIYTNDGDIEVVSTNYENANIQVDGKLYMAKDTSIFDMMDAAASGTQFHPEDKVSVKYVGTYRESSENIEILPKPDIGIGYDEIMNAEKTEVTSFKSSQSVGIMYTVTLYDNSTGNAVYLRSSDHSEADAIIGGKYYKCEKAKELLKAISVTTYIQYHYNSKYAAGTSERIETDRLEQWYKDFKAKGYKPRSYLDEIQAYELFIVLFNTKDGPVSISTTSYKNANIIIGNEYYFLSPEELDEFKALVMDVYEHNG